MKFGPDNYNHEERCSHGRRRTLLPPPATIEADDRRWGTVPLLLVAVATVR